MTAGIAEGFKLLIPLGINYLSIKFKTTEVIAKLFI